ncbi:MAG: PQQ-binding-like beta-propeller repeat protein, partial [Candidatus Methanofastidiosia archaeon]
MKVQIKEIEDGVTRTYICSGINVIYEKVIETSIMIKKILMILMIVAIGSALSIENDSSDNTEGNFDWPQYMHDAQHITYSKSPAPDKPEILWIYDFKHNIRASPIISEGLVIIGPSIELGIPPPSIYEEPKLYALDEDTGEIIWTHKMEHFRIENPVAVDGDSVFVFDFKESSNPIYYLKSLDIKSGEMKWKVEIPKRGNKTPTVVNGKIFLSTAPMISLNQEDGSKIWDVYESNDSDEYDWGPSPPTVAENKVFAILGRMGDEKTLYCFDELTGKEIWRFENPYLTQPPIYFKGKVFVVSSGKLYALNPNNGEVIWEVGDENSWVSGLSIAIDHEKIFIANSESEIISLNLNTGKMIWESQSLDLFPSYNLVAADKKVFVVLRFGRIYALDAENGEILWEYELEGEIFDLMWAPAIANGKLFVATQKLYVFASDPKIFEKSGNKYLESENVQRALEQFETAKRLYGEQGNTKKTEEIEKKIEEL